MYKLCKRAKFEFGLLYLYRLFSVDLIKPLIKFFADGLYKPGEYSSINETKEATAISLLKVLYKGCWYFNYLLPTLNTYRFYVVLKKMITECQDSPKIVKYSTYLLGLQIFSFDSTMLKNNANLNTVSFYYMLDSYKIHKKTDLSLKTTDEEASLIKDKMKELYRLVEENGINI